MRCIRKTFRKHLKTLTEFYIEVEGKEPVPLASVGWINGAGAVVAGLAGTLLGALALQRWRAPRAVVAAMALQAAALILFMAGVAAPGLGLPAAGPGWLAQHLGYGACFGLAAVLGAAGLPALFVLMRRAAPPSSSGE